MISLPQVTMARPLRRVTMKCAMACSIAMQLTLAFTLYTTSLHTPLWQWINASMIESEVQAQRYRAFQIHRSVGALSDEISKIRGAKKWKIQALQEEGENVPFALLQDLVTSAGLKVTSFGQLQRGYEESDRGGFATAQIDTNFLQLEKLLRALAESEIPLRIREFSFSDRGDRSGNISFCLTVAVIQRRVVDAISCAERPP